MALPLVLALVGTGYGLRARFGGNGTRPPILDGRRALDLEAWLEAQAAEQAAGHSADDEDEAGDDAADEPESTAEEGGDFGDGELRVVRRVRRVRVATSEPEVLDGFEDEAIYGHIGLAYDEEGYGIGSDDDYFGYDDEPDRFDDEDDPPRSRAAGPTEACTGNLLCVVASAAGSPPPSLPYGSVRAWTQASESFRKGEFHAAASGFARVAAMPLPDVPKREVAAERQLLCLQAAAAWLADPDRVLGATEVRGGGAAGEVETLGRCAPAVDALLGRRARQHQEAAPDLTHL